MKSALIANKKIALFDTTLINTLQLKVAEISAVRKERMIIAIRNENGSIYRIIGITGLTLFFEITDKLTGLNMVDELAYSINTTTNFDAIFRVR